MPAPLMMKTGAILMATGLVFLWFAPQPAAQGQKPASTEERDMAVQVIMPQRFDENKTVSFNAQLVANKQATLFARASGFVQERLVDIGDRVEEGQLLLRLNAPEMEAALQSQKAQQALAEAELQLARTSLMRAKSLVETGATSKAALDRAQADVNVKSAMLKARQADVEGTRAMIDYLAVRAPFAGIITERNVEKGDKASPNDQRPLFKLINTDQMRVVIDMPQTQYYLVDFKQPGNLVVQGQDAGIPITFSRAAQAVDDTNGTVQIEYLLSGRAHQLLSGLNVRVDIPLLAANSLRVPNSVMINKSGQVFVYVVDEKGGLQERAVVTGRSLGNDIEITSGLGLSDRVVINPNALLQAGDNVRVVDKAPSSP